MLKHTHIYATKYWAAFLQRSCTPLFFNIGSAFLWSNATLSTDTYSFGPYYFTFKSFKTEGK